MRQITIKDWLYLQNANELETISRVLDISIDDLNKKSVEDFLICRNETNKVLTELKEVSPSNEFVIEGENYIVLETYRDMSVADWLDVESIIKTEKGYDLWFKLFILLSRKNITGKYKQSLDAEEYDYREKTWLELPAKYMLQTSSFFLQKLKKLEEIGQLYTQLQNLKKNPNIQEMEMRFQKDINYSEKSTGFHGFFFKLLNNYRQSLIRLNLWLSMTHLHLLVSLSRKRELLKILRDRDSYNKNKKINI